MRKFVLCTVLLFFSMPLLAGLSIDVTGGVKRLIHQEYRASETFPVIGINANYSIPKTPISIRESFEYGWESKTIPRIEGDFAGYEYVVNEYDVNATFKTILLAVQYNIEMPGAPVSFYIGAGPEIVIFDASEIPIGEGIKRSMDYNDEGALIYAGGNFNMGAMSLFAEAGFGIFFEEFAPNHDVPISGGMKYNF
jgi:hypothetical protein